MPRWVEPMPSVICMNPGTSTGHTLLVLRQINFNTTTSSKARSDWKVIHWRSGSRPWTLCSCPWKRCWAYHDSFSYNNYSLGIIWSCIYDFVLCNRVSDRDCPSLIPFSDKLKVLAFCRSLRLPNLYLDLPSSNTPWYLEDINPLHYILWIFDEVIPFPIIVTPRVLGYRQPRTPICESNQHCDSALPVLCCWEV